MKKTTFLSIALLGAVVCAAALGAYAWYARNSAIRGWTHAARVEQSAQTALHVFAAPKVMADAGVTVATSRLDVIEATRDLIYRQSRVGPSQGDFLPWERYLEMVSDGLQQLCDGMGMTYQFALDVQGIPSRPVILAAKSYIDGEQLGDTHFTIEVFYNGKWFVSDPTFNVHFDCSNGDEFLSIPEMRQCIADGHDLVPVPGKTQIAGRQVQDYYLPYETLLYAYQRGATEAAGQTFPVDEVPEPGWWEKAKQRYSDYYGGYPRVVSESKQEDS